MSRQRQSLAQRFRRSRERFLLARELGCSPAQALERKRQQEADQLWRESGDRLRAALAKPSNRAATHASVVKSDPTTPPAPRMWWLD